MSSRRSLNKRFFKKLWFPVGWPKRKHRQKQHLPYDFYVAPPEAVTTYSLPLFGPELMADIQADGLKIEKGSNDVFEMWEPVTGPIHPEISDSLDVAKREKPSGDVFLSPEPVDGDIVGVSTASDLVVPVTYLVTPVEWNAGTAVTVVGDKVTSTGGTGWTNSGTSSVNSISTGPCELNWKQTSSTLYACCGLSKGDASLNFNEIDFAFAPNGSAAAIYENGSLVSNPGGWTTSQTLTVKVRDGVVSYYVNGVWKYDSGEPPAYPLLVDSSFYSNGAEISSASVGGTGSARVLETLAVAAVAANIVTAANDAETYSYSIQSQTPSGDYFAISGTDLVVGSLGLDYETDTSHTLVIRATDGSSNYFDQTIVIEIIDVGGS